MADLALKILISAQNTTGSSFTGLTQSLNGVNSASQRLEMAQKALLASQEALTAAQEAGITANESAAAAADQLATADEALSSAKDALTIATDANAVAQDRLLASNEALEAAQAGLSEAIAAGASAADIEAASLRLASVSAEQLAVSQTAAAAATDVASAADQLAAVKKDQLAASNAALKASTAASSATQTEAAAATRAVAAAETEATASTDLFRTSINALAGPIALILAAIGVGAAIVSAKAVQMAGDFQQSMAKVQAYAGLTKKQTDDMGNSILKLGPELGQTPKQLADGFYSVASAGFKGAAGLTVLTDAGKIAASGNVDASVTSKALVSSLNALGLSASSAGNISDELNATVKNGVMSWSDYGNVVGKVAGFISSTGTSANLMQRNFTDANASIDTYTNSGISAQLASTYLKNTMNELYNKTDTLAKNATKLGISFDESKFKSMDFQHQLQYLQEITHGNSSTMLKLAGGNSIAANTVGFLNAHYKDLGTTITNINGAMKNGKTTQDMFTIAQQGWNFQLQQIKASLDAMLIRIGQQLIPALQAAGAKILPVIKGFADWVQKSGVLQGAINAVIGVVNGLTNGFVTVAGWVQKIADFFQHNAAAAGVLKGALAAFAGVITGVLVVAFGAWAWAAGAAAVATLTTLSPVLLIGMAIGALAGIFVLLYNKCQPVHDAMNAIGKAFQQVGSFLMSGLMTALKAIGQFLIATFTPVWKQLVSTFQSQLMPAWKNLVAAIQPLMPVIKLVAAVIGGVLAGAFILIVGLIGGFVRGIAGALTGIITAFGGVVQFITGVVQVISGIISVIIDICTGHFDKLGGDLGRIWDGIKNMFLGAWNAIKGIFQGAIGAITGFVGGFMSTVGGILGKILGVKSGVTTAMDDMSHKCATSALQMQVSAVDHVMQMQQKSVAAAMVMRTKLVEEIKNTTDPVKKHALEMQLVHTNAMIRMKELAVMHTEQARVQVIAKAKQMAAQHAEESKNIFQKAGDWFGKTKDAVVQKTQELAKGIGDKLKDVGTWFHDRFEDARKAVEGVFSTIGKWFSDRWNDIYTPLKPIIGFIGAVFQTAWNIIVAIMGKLKAWFSDRWNDIVKVFSVVGQWFKDRFTTAWNNIVTIFTPIKQWFTDRWNDIVAVFQVVGKWFSDRFTEAWNNIVTLFTPIGQWFTDRWNDVMAGVNTFKQNVSDTFNTVKTDVTNIFHDMINGIIDKLNDGISAVENFVNFFGQGLNSIATSLGTKGTIPKLTLGRIPHYESGTANHPGGPAIVGERGPEMVMLPRGTSVMPHTQTAQPMGGIPGYAGGTGNALGDFMSWVGSGAKSVVDHVISALNIKAPDLGGLTNISSGIFNTVKGWAETWLQNILPKPSAGGGTAGPGKSVNIPGSVADWINAAISLTGVPANWESALATIAMYESGGNPNAQNNTDSNAAAGDPSRGLMQTIGATFSAYMAAGHGNILNPIDNAAAAINYIKARYGTVFNVPGIESLAKGGGYVGYAKGGIINEPIAGVGLKSGTKYAFGENGSEAIIPLNGMAGTLSASASSLTGQASSWGANLHQGLRHRHRQLRLRRAERHCRRLDNHRRLHRVPFSRKSGCWCDR